jgi:DNA-binding response OmpR family regulator
MTNETSAHAAGEAPAPGKMNASRIAILDDDLIQRELLLSVLGKEGFDVTPFSRTGPLIAALRKDTFDLLMVDWNLPDRSGLEAIEWARVNLTPSPPMLLLTSRSDDQDIIAGLNAGADDYLVKPVANGILVAKVRALLRRTSANPQNVGGVIRAGGAEFDTFNSNVVIHRHPVALTAKEFALALLLFQNINRALSRSYIVTAVWGVELDVSSRTLDMHISRVRTKLKLYPAGGYKVSPVYSYGYRLEHVEIP